MIHAFPCSPLLSLIFPRFPHPPQLSDRDCGNSLASHDSIYNSLSCYSHTIVIPLLHILKFDRFSYSWVIVHASIHCNGFLTTKNWWLGMLHASPTAGGKGESVWKD